LFLKLSDTQTTSSSSVILTSSPPIQKTLSSFSKSFIYSGKQGGGVRVLGEGHDIVTRETCLPTSLNVNNLGKAAVLHFAFTLFCDWGCAKFNL
jgi:hypothetical protein